MGMTDKLTFNLDFLEENRARVEVFYRGEVHMGTLYFERPKKMWVNKPIMNMKWACVDAKVEGLYEVGESITPKEIIAFCQDLISAQNRESSPNQ